MDMTSNVVAGEIGELGSILMDGGDRFGVSTVLFDSHEELIWVGNEGGHITSYFGSEMQKYTSFQAHENEVRHLLTNDGGVLSLTHNEIRFTKRQGLKLFSLSGSNMTDMQCMLQKDDSTLLIAGHQDEIFELDLNRHKILQEYTVEPGTCIMKVSSRYLCCGDSSGKIRLRDPKTLKCEHVLSAHSGTLSDFDVLGNTLVTCGFSSRQGHLSADRFLMMYDMRMLRSLAPLQTPMLEPFMLKFSSTMSSRVQVVSHSGQLQFLDIGGHMTARSMYIYHVNTHGGMVAGFDISPNGQASVFGDSAGVVHLWVDHGMEHLAFNIYSRPTNFADEIHHSHPLAIDDDSVPYSSFPLPHCSEPLLSDWPKKLLKRRDRRTPPIDPEILRAMVVKGFIGQAPNPGNRLRNQVPYIWRSTSKQKRVPESPMNREQNPFSSLVPKIYRRVEMRYSKLGVDDFNFQHYNKTSFAGLEIHIPNAYCNCMLQTFYFLEPLKVSLQNHLCKKEFCLACELGFLFDMLDQSSGQTCQASNFLRAFRTLREASALGLLLPDTDESLGRVNYPRLIQSWQRFVLQQLHRDTEVKHDESEEGNETERVTALINSLFGSQVQRTSQCSQCGAQTTRDDITLLTALSYPDNPENQAISFVNVLQSSLLGVQTSPAWCENCNKFQPTIHSKKLSRLPDVLSVNCQIDAEKHKEFWNRKKDNSTEKKPKDTPVQNTRSNIPCRFGDGCTRVGCTFWHTKDGEQTPAEPELTVESSREDCVLTWVPFFMKLRLADDGTLVCLDLNSEDESLEDGDIIYDLKSSVAHIQDYNSPGNLVAMINVDKSYHKEPVADEDSSWYLFNDFGVSEISKGEAVEFDLSWKTPCILQFVRRNMNTDYDLTVCRTIDKQIILGDVSLSQLHNAAAQRSFTPLNLNEVIQEGVVVGIDCEFVTLNQEESEIRSDGTRSTVKPSHMSAARVTCVRGEGPLRGRPFIDDYISTSEQVVDYLTEFSGINPGDLDVALSSKHLTTLKTTYLKLKYLLQHNVLFVGHGLKKDFRVLNIMVPKSQIVDTVQLFHLPQQRFISLRFLAWYFL
ncbi:PAN2-PAN3 deadenylation complex catalytic subunit PAN2 isoform X1, partial [Paramuricea clavata]